MEQNKFYCRNNAHSTTSSLSSSSSTSQSNNSGSQDYLAQSSGNFSCKEPLSKNGNKSIYNSRGTNISASIGSNSSNSSGYCSSTSSGNANNNNVMSGTGTAQYQRKKLQEYQPRLHYNTTDYKCRDDNYSIGRCSSSPSPSLQLQSTHQHIQKQQQQQQSQQQQTQTQNHLNNHQQHTHQMQLHHHQSTCTTNTATDVIDESINPESVSDGNVESCDHQSVVPLSVSMDSTVPNSGSGGGSSGQSMIYTVHHRVVTTAQIQTALGNTYTSSSSVSSVVSAVRNESDCMTATASSGSCLTEGGTVSDVINIALDSSNCGASNNVGLRISPGPSTNTNLLQHQQKCNHTSEMQSQSTSTRMGNSNYNSTTSTNTGYLSGAKSSSASSSVAKPLQNVIPTCVYLMSRVAVHMEIEGTAQCPTQVMLAAALGCEELGIANKLLAQSIFGLWMTSALLEIQLKSHHRPYLVRVAWQSLLEKFSLGNPIEKKFDEPMIMLKRNVFFSKRDEEKIKDHRILELLYEEAKQNVLSGRYVMEPVHSLMLGGIQARIELGPYNSHIHTIRFFRENQSRFLPQHVAKSSNWSWLPVSRKNSAEVKLLEQFKRVPQTATTRKLMRKYLEFCWALPFYGAAFFQAQVEQPVRGLMSLVNHKDVEVIIAINERGLYIIDPVESTLLLGLRYEDLSWDFAKPSVSEDPECQTCIFIQFDAVENGIQISKLMQIFSKQAAMIDALITHFTEQMRKRKQEGSTSEQFHDEPNPIQNNGNGVLCNKLSRLTLATFDEEGRCIGQMGSLSISY